MNLIVSVESKTVNHKDSGGNPVILVTFKAQEGMATFHAYLSAEEAKQFELGDAHSLELGAKL